MAEKETKQKEPKIEKAGQSGYAEPRPEQKSGGGQDAGQMLAEVLEGYQPK